VGTLLQAFITKHMNIQAITLLSTNTDETKKFYSGILQLVTIEHDKTKLTIKAGDSLITFLLTDKQIKPVYHIAFNIPSNKFDEAFEWVSHRVKLIENANKELITNFENWRAKSFYFYDNNNNILEFIARFDLDNKSTRKFTAKEVLSVSEIGVVTDNPLVFAEQLFTQFQLEYFTKSPKREDFVAMGDD
jgi:catechol-2,3-dioxygenase